MSHDHDHATVTMTSDLGRAFQIGVVLNVAFVALEAAFGVLAHSTALIADPEHNLSDVLGLAMAWGASALAHRVPSSLHTYGFRRSSVLASLADAVLLLAAVGAVAWEAIERFGTPAEPHGKTMMWVAAAGVVVPASRRCFFAGAAKTTSTSAAPSCIRSRTPRSPRAWS